MSERQKKILILHTSVGLGHKSIAENIGFYLSREGFEVKLADIGQVQKGKFERAVTSVHGFINRFVPSVWGWLYNWGHLIILPFRVSIAGRNCEQAKKLIADFQPDLIISTQTSSSAVVAYLKREDIYKNKFAIAFSDYHLHPYWLYKQADFYLANIEEQKQEMLRQNISADRIYVCGITLKPKINVDVQAVKNRLGIKAEERVVLVGTGSLGIGFDLDDLKVLRTLPDVKIIFACGKNEQLYNEISQQNYQNVLPLRFYRPMDELYAIAGVFISKPGGLTTAEALRWDLPMIITFTLPGQELKNLTYLISHQLIIARPLNLVAAVESELHDEQFRKQLAKNTQVGVLTDRVSVLIKAVRSALH